MNFGDVSDMRSVSNLKATVSQFQSETNSNSVLDFVTWYSNKIELGKQFRAEASERKRKNE